MDGVKLCQPHSADQNGKGSYPLRLFMQTKQYPQQQRRTTSLVDSLRRRNASVNGFKFQPQHDAFHFEKERGQATAKGT